MSLPYQAQTELLSALLSNVAVCRELVDVLERDHWLNPAVGLVAQHAMRIATEQNQPPTEGQMLEALDGLQGETRDSALSILSAASLCKAPPAEWSISAGRKMAAEARLLILAAQAEEYASRGDFSEFAEAARGAASVASGRGSSTTGLGDVLDRHSQVAHKGIPTGIEPLNDLLWGGGWQPGQLILVLAASGKGKTHAATSFGAEALKAGYRVHDTTLEMGAEEKQCRYDRSLSGLGEDFVNHLHNTREQLEHWEKNLTILEAVDRPLTVHGLEADIRRLAPEQRPHLMIVDYPLLLDFSKYAGGDSTAMRTGIERTHQALRILGKSIGAAMICPFQVNRGGLNNQTENPTYVVTDADMAGCFDVSRHADIIMSLNQTRVEKSMGVGRLFVDKNRRGVGGVTINCTFDWERSRLRDV